MDIIILIYLSIKIFNKAEQKNERPWSWVGRLALLFLSTEMVVAFAVISYFGTDKLLYAVFPALFAACLSAYFVFKQLSQKTNINILDNFEENTTEEETEKPNLDYFR